METKIKLFSMFSGFGGGEFALQKAGIPFECIGISEIDKFAIQCYNQNFPNIKNYGDCIKINPNELPNFDLLTGGFPCQDVSIAGKRDLSKGRTNLYQEILK
jgi:DNA (cytosine-5)-methyltransferase 1